MVGRPPEFFESKWGYGWRWDARKSRRKKVFRVLERLDRQRKDFESLEGLAIQGDRLKEFSVSKYQQRDAHTTELNSLSVITSV